MAFPWSPYGGVSPFNQTLPQGRSFNTDVVTIPDGSSPSTTWLPLYNLRTTYQEDEIVNLIHEIVQDYVRLSGVLENEVVWAPAGGHHLDESLCNLLGISETAKSLIRLLPVPGPNHINQINLFESSSLIDVTTSSGLKDSREAPPRPDSARGYILPHEVQLAIGDSESSAIILDTNENTIRVVSLSEGTEAMNPPWAILEKPQDPYHYRNYWPRHAPTWLRVHLQKIKSLDTIPPGIQEYALGYLDFEYEWMRRKIKHTLEGTYGWPSNFQQLAWDQDRERIWEEADQEFERLGRPDVLRFL
ncbi:hypothetical protein CJF32_00009906 [Rutstroemia sp. NJR-2017a WRK4]|nr:hypothetical protein CJF32_00009906 [Rutstroemia sp. NJR-2017a WRK4]